MKTLTLFLLMRLGQPKNVYNTEILYSGYALIRIDRGGRGGGVLLGIRARLFKYVREI